ncbi:MAG: DNA polymerase I [Elusimicrobiaceae bacterium]|nr:DNA polymerase I [Elusimicrobiaceae bacterium]
MLDKKFFIIDAHGILHRNYHALPPLTSAKGEEVGALYGFVNWLLKFLENKKPTHVAVCFDSKGPTFRHEIFKDYKANRPPTDEALVSQLKIAREVCAALGLKVIALQGAEADDLMASCAKIAGKDDNDTIIITSDKDIYQIVGQHVKLWSGSPQDEYRDDNVCQNKFGVPCKYMADYLALLGDSSDNVPGVEGIGAKSAQTLVSTFGSVEDIIKAAKENNPNLKDALKKKILKGEESAKLSKQLILLKDNLLDLQFDDFKVSPPNLDEVKTFAERFEFKNLNNFLKDHQKQVEQKPQAELFTQGELFDDFSANTPKQEKVLPNPQDFKTILNKACGAFELFIYAEEDALMLALNSKDFSFKKIQEITTEEKEILNQIVQDNQTLKLAHDLKYTLRALNIAPKKQTYLNVFDFELAAYCLNPAQDFSLNNLFASNLKITVNRDAELNEKFTIYTQNIFDLKKHFENILQTSAQAKVFKEIEIPLESVLLAMESDGIEIDITWLKTLALLLSSEMETTQKEIDKLVGGQVNINSPKQLGVLLFEKLKLPTLRKTKTGYSTDEETLESLKKFHPVCELILKYREAAKLKTTYVDSLLDLADNNRRVHTNFNQTGTVTGRLSSFNPNLQNIPARSEKGRLIRQAFCAGPGKVLLSLDYSQIDLRVLAHVSQDETLIHAFKCADDIHTRTASEVFNKPIAEVTKEDRAHAKGINFGIVYGQGPMALSQTLGITMTQAKDYIDSYFARYDTVKSWINKTVAEARKTGFVTTLLGHIRYLPEFQDSNPRMVSFASRAAVNTVVQGGSSDIIKKAMLDIYKELPEDINLLLQIHDELVFELPEEKLKTFSVWAIAKMENCLPLRVPLVAKAKAGKNLNNMGPVL